MVTQQATVTGFNVFANVREGVVFFGVVTDASHDPTILKREQVKHVGTYDHIAGETANVTLDELGQLIELEVPPC